ncbi:MAG: DUF2851 family protein [Saprospiraceae bacterium]
MKNTNSPNFNLIKEDFIHYLWRTKLLPAELLTLQGQSVQILDFGTGNMDSGPDFFNAKVVLDDQLWVGNVEMHVFTSDWIKHRHSNDDAYKNVILHVVWTNDLVKIELESIGIPTLVLNGLIPKIYLDRYLLLKNSSFEIPCKDQIATVKMARVSLWMERMAVERIEAKAQAVYTLFQNTSENWEETLYIMLVRYFGTKVNREPFERLARAVPMKLILLNRDKPKSLEALYFGQAGMLRDSNVEGDYYGELSAEYNFLQRKYGLTPMDPMTWKFGKIRPANFPTIRIAQLSAIMTNARPLFSVVLEMQELSELRAFFNKETTEFWDKHYTFSSKSKFSKKEISDSFFNLICINAIGPMLFAYGKMIRNDVYILKAMHILESISPEKNAIITGFEKLGIGVTSAYDSQACIHLKTNYCDLKKCLSCQIGHDIIKG